MGFFRALQTTVGRKILMAVTGLLLCGFLVFHLAGNFFLYVGADAYNEYAEKLHSLGGLLMVAEVGLFTLFALHIYLAFATAAQNRAARQDGYSMKQSKQTKKFSFFPENWMMISGLIVLGFMILHLSDFKMELRPDLEYEGLSQFDKAVTILTNPISMTVYTLGTLVLGFHLAHGFASAFQTLGATNAKWRSRLKLAAVVFGIVIGAGFASFVAWANFGQPTLQGTEAAVEAEQPSGDVTSPETE